uniref:SH3-domain binding protein 1 n=1 Tax=Knipowitschia caucasica TaxID=637954 RepID=A0AAV2LUS5_KNICA
MDLASPLISRSNDAAELLHEDLIQVDQRVEPAKKAAHLLHKKLLSCMQSQSGVEAEKRMKKLPLMQLSVGMAECLKDFDADSSIRRVLEMCCFLEKRLAYTLAKFEVKVEKDVLEPLNKLGEEDLPDILKNRQHFVKLTRDWNNARIRSQTSTGAQAKQEGLREELEEAWRRLENIKDQYSADLYHFASKEDDYANHFIRLLELQAEYYRNSFEFLDKNIRELRENHSGSSSSSSPWQPSVSSQRVYGEPLLSHLSLTQRDIAAPIQECVHMLLRTGMREEGLFRLAAAASVVKRLKTCLDHGAVDHSEFSMDPHAVAGALKSYLRELPEPLMTFELYGGWFKAAGEKEHDEKLQQFRKLLEKLPPENYNNLRFLVQFLSLLSEQQAVNKMTPSNIAIVLGPNLLWPLAEGEAALFDMAAASSVQVVTVIEPLIQNCSLLFPEEVSFEVPDVPECSSDLSSPASGTEKLSRTFSSTSSASSCSSYHTPLSKTNSSASQDSTSFFIPKSGSISRSGTSSWAGPTSEVATPQNQSSSSGCPSQSPSPALSSSTSTSASASTSASTPGPTQPLLPRTQAPNSGHNQSSEQVVLEPILEAAPNSPRGFVKITSPFKPKRSFVLKQNHHSEQPTVQFSKTPAAQGPAPHPPLRISRTQPTLQPRAPPDLRKAPLKKPGIKAPNCPPPLPPPSQAI